MDETQELIRLYVRSLVAQMGAAPRFELHMTRACVLGLTDEPLADFNMLILGPDPDAEGFLTRSVARAKARTLPLMAVMSPHVVEALSPLAPRLGLTPAGTAPLSPTRRGAVPSGRHRRWPSALRGSRFRARRRPRRLGPRLNRSPVASGARHAEERHSSLTVPASGPGSSR